MVAPKPRPSPAKRSLPSRFPPTWKELRRRSPVHRPTQLPSHVHQYDSCTLNIIAGSTSEELPEELSGRAASLFSRASALFRKRRISSRNYLKLFLRGRSVPGSLR